MDGEAEDRPKVVRSERASQNGQLNLGIGARNPAPFSAVCVTLHTPLGIPGVCHFLE